MATTPVFAEILVLGLEVEAWLGLLIVSAFGTDWVPVDEIKDFAALATIIVPALGYVLGIFADRLADTVLDRVEKTKRGTRIKARMSKNNDLREREKLTDGKISMMRMIVMY